MSISIYYKDELLLGASAASMDDLAEKLLALAKKNSLDPQFNLIYLIKKIISGYGSHIELDLDSKKEVLQFAELIDIAANEWEKEGFFKYHEQIKDGKVINPKLDKYRQLANRIREIALYEWKNENLFISRAYKLQPLAQMLLHFAHEKNIDPNCHLMKFLRSLTKAKLYQDIDIRSKEELKQFIELMELSVQKLIADGYSKQYNFTVNGTTFNYLQHNYLTYITRLKEVAADWDNAVSDEWKQGKLLTKLQPKVRYEIRPTVDPSYVPEPIIKDIIKLIGYTFLLIAIILVAMWLLTLIAQLIL